MLGLATALHLKKGPKMGLVTTVQSLIGQLEVKCLSMTTHADNITPKMPQLCEIDHVTQYTRQPSDWIVDYIST